MKTMKNNYFLTTIALMALMISCTDDFNEINEKPDALAASDVSAKFFVTNAQTGLFAPNRYPYWRGPIIHADRYAGHTAFGYKSNWWDDGLGYNYSAGYTSAVHDAWFASYNSTLSAFTNFVKEGGTLENDKYYAIALIMKGLYYQYYTDAFGMVPMTEASNPDIVTPKYDTQLEIYSTLVSDLDQAISLIGNDATTGSGVDQLAENDLFFNGDLQAWKQLANSLKLRLGLRALGAPGESFSSSAVASAVSGGVLADRDALLPRDLEISTWVSAVYGDVWGPFYGGGNWHLAKTLVDALRDNNDPRLSKYAKPSKGGTIEWAKPTEGERVALFDKHVAYMTDILDSAGATYTKTSDGAGGYTITMPENTNYIGQPTRLNGKIKPLLDRKLWSEPSEVVVNQHNSGKPIFPFVVMTAAESHFMVAEAITKGLANGDAQGHYQTAIRHAMNLWGVSSADADNYIATEGMALLNGSTDQNLEKIATQRWIALFTNGYEAWSVVRDTGYPTELSAGVTDGDIFVLGDTNGVYPQRHRYGSGPYNTNGAQVEQANSVQGPDKQATKLWWAK